MSLRPPSHFTVAPHVEGFRSVMVNYYFAARSGERSDWVLIDAGLRGSGPRLLREAEKRFGVGAQPRAIVLTHGHFDHIGALPWLLRRWQVPVYAHADELPFLNERVAYPPPDPAVGGMMALSSPLYPRHAAKFAAVVEPLAADGSVPHLPGWRWISTPGHTPGHVSLWRESDRLMITGDAIVTTRQESALAVLRQELEVRPPPPYFTPDWRQSYESIVRIRSFAPHKIATGHGVPAEGQFLRQHLDRLVTQFDSVGLPRRGRYVPKVW